MYWGHEGPALMLVVLYFLFISLQKALNDDFVVITDVTKFHPISSPAVVAVEYIKIAFLLHL